MLIFHVASLDSIANSIASSTFDVINDGKIRTADMGGMPLCLIRIMSPVLKQNALGNATTSDFTNAVISRL